MSGNLLKTCDFVNLCRVCGKQSNKMISLFGIRKKGLMLAEMLSICTQSRVKQTDRFPSNICNQCLSNLEVAFDFYNLVKTSEDRFQKIISIEDSKRKVHSIDLCATPEDANEYVKAELNDEPQENSHHLILDEDHEQKPAAKIVALKVPPDEIQAYQRLLHDKKMHRLFECFMCKAKLKTFKDMRSHLKRHNEATPFKCKICQMLFSAQQYEQHLCKGQSVQCSYCPETFQTTKSLLDHLQGHEEQHNLHKCPDCSKLFPMMFLLDCHRAQHGQIERPYVCHICNRGFRVKFLLTKHLSTHSNERPHLCSTCGMGFKTMGTLRSHAIRHSGFKPVACSKCPKRFFSKADLRKHMDVHSDAKYVCNLCGASLSSKRSLDEHRRHRHRKAEEQTCDLCSMKFRTVYNLKRHLLTHTGEKPHKCLYCDRAFAQSGDLNKHLRSHIGEKTYQCEICSKSFRLQIELRKHSYEHFQNENQTTSQIF